MKVKEWLKNRWKELQINDPNSAEGFRERAKRLLKQGYPFDSPYISMLVKRAMMQEDHNAEIPSPDSWELMSDEDREAWVRKELGWEWEAKV